MPSHLHPRSRLTTSLFGTTLLVSFLVVGMPHILPCPAPRTTFADTDVMEGGRRRQRQRRRTVQPGGEDQHDERKRTQSPEEEEDQADRLGGVSEKEMLSRRAHQCPVPKPGGRIGQVLGFREGGKDSDT